MASGENDRELFDAFFVWLRGKGLTEPLLLEPQNREGAGKGLFVTQQISANTTVLKVPAPALINIKTLRHQYKDYALEGFYTSTGQKTTQLNGTQLISLHLALHRPQRRGERSTDPMFGPYISVLPGEFDAHPLAWLARRADRRVFEEGMDFGQELLEHLPPSVSSELTSLWKKFRGDWEVVKDSWQAHSKQTEGLNASALTMTGPQADGKTLQVRYPNFLWAWLIVNTRCLYLRLFNSDLPLSNLTLCPMIDFANHTTSTDTRPGAFPQIRYPSEPRPSNLNKFLAPGAAHDMVFMSPPDRELNEGEEIFLRYGGHCNRTLFVEYGFVDEHGDPSISEVNVEDLVDSMFRDNGKFGEDCRDLLKKEGYTDKWCLFLSPAPPHPSYTLITALRLLNSRRERQEEDQVSWSDAFTAQLSETVEALVRQDLERLCQSIIERSKIALDRLREAETVFPTQIAPSTSSWVVDNVRELWLEEDKVGRAVLSSLQSGVRLSDFP